MIPKFMCVLLTKEILIEWIVGGNVYACKNINATEQYGKLSIYKDRILVQSFQPEKPKEKDPILIPFGSETQTVGRAIVAVDELTPRALNFLLLCSGLKGKTYEGSIVWVWNNTIGTNPLDIGTVVRTIKDGGTFQEVPVDKGSVIGCSMEHEDYLSGFDIFMKDGLSGVSDYKIGLIEDGFDVCKKVFSGAELYITKCGLVI